MTSVFKRVALAAMLAATAVAGPAASRVTENEILVQFFANEARTIQVGESFHGCDGTGYSWGERTLISDRYVTPCP
jgi:erythromycin esterase-like protein